MVTLQILVLPFLVRVRVPQREETAKKLKIKRLAVFLFIHYPSFSRNYNKRRSYPADNCAPMEFDKSAKDGK